MAGYTKSYLRTNGEVVDAVDFSNEFTAIESAFNSASGHKHDGTAGNGAFIPSISTDGLTAVTVDGGNNKVVISTNVSSVKTAQIEVVDGILRPVTHNDVDIGSNLIRFKDIYSAGVVYATELTFPASAQISAILDEDTMVSDSATALATQQSIKAYVSSSITTHAHDGASASYTSLIASADGINTVEVDDANNRIVIAVDVAGIKTTQLYIGTAGITPAGATTDIGSVAVPFNNLYTNNILSDTLNLSGSTTVQSVLNESDLVSNSNVALATQQSIKSYVDTTAALKADFVLNNFTGTTAPTANDDSVDGYSAGSLWYDSVAAETYRCVDATASAAVWVLTSLTADELGAAAFLDVGTLAGTVAAGDHNHSTVYLGITATAADSNLLDAQDGTYYLGRANHTGTQLLNTISDAGGAAALNVGTLAGTVAAGDDSRFHDAVTAGTGISVTGQQVTNTDLGSTATSTHESTYWHSNSTPTFNDVVLPPSAIIGSPTHALTAGEHFNHIQSAALMDGCDITDNLDGTVSFTTGFGLLRASDIPDSTLYAVEVPAQGPVTLTDNSINYVYLDWNSGVPQLSVSTTFSIINCMDKCIAYSIYRNGTNLNVIDARAQNVDANRKIRQLFYKFSRFIHAAAGSLLGANGLALIVTAGEFFFMIQTLPHSAYDTSIAGTDNLNVFKLWYRDGIGSWTETADQKVISTTTYDNNTGTPVVLANNKYGISWVYLVHDNPTHLHVVMGQEEYADGASAASAQPPGAVPGIIAEQGSLIGFVTYLKSATAFTGVYSAFAQAFAGAAAVAHNLLPGLQGGTLDEYYHLTLANYTALTPSNIAITGGAINGTVVGTTTPATGAFTALSSTGLDVAANSIRVQTAKTPATATDTGTTGDICWDADYIYVCIAANTWKRTAITTW